MTSEELHKIADEWLTNAFRSGEIDAYWLFIRWFSKEKSGDPQKKDHHTLEYAEGNLRIIGTQFPLPYHPKNKGNMMRQICRVWVSEKLVALITKDNGVFDKTRSFYLADLDNWIKVMKEKTPEADEIKLHIIYDAVEKEVLESMKQKGFLD